MGPVQCVVVGADIGQSVDPTAIAVVERSRRVTEPGRWVLPSGDLLVDGRDIRMARPKTETVHTCRYIGRLPLATPYPQVAEHIVAVVAGLVKRGVGRPRIAVDATGVGAPVVDLLRERLGHHARNLIAVTFVHGENYTQDNDARTARLGKAYLVSTVQALLQTDRLKLPRTAESEALRRELIDYEIKVDEDGTDRYGAFRTGAHDDLATALGLALVYALPPSGRVASYN